MLHSKESWHSINSYFILFRSYVWLLLLTFVSYKFIRKSDLSFKTTINHENHASLSNEIENFFDTHFIRIDTVSIISSLTVQIVGFLSRILIVSWATRANEFEWMFNRTFVLLFSNNYFYRFFPDLLPADKIIEAHRSIRHSMLQQIWWLHCSLANATEIINSVYAIQLLFWISTMSFNLMSRIYSLKVFKLSDYGKIRESMLVTDCAWNLVLITTVCHMTAHQVDLSLNQTEISRTPHVRRYNSIIICLGESCRQAYFLTLLFRFSEIEFTFTGKQYSGINKSWSLIVSI